MGLKTVAKYLIKLSVRAVLKNDRKQGLFVQFSEILSKKEGRRWQYFDERFDGPKPNQCSRNMNYQGSPWV